MCGIGGVYLKPGRNFSIESFLKHVIRTQEHRGPDAQDLWVSEDHRCGLSHNRLAIVGLGPDGHQPMRSACGNFYITFNGEIYNHKDIRDQLKKIGINCKTNSDTEVLLNAYILWGESSLNRLHGMYAFAIYNTVEKTLFCARDPIGEKPFIYKTTDDGFFFSSEIPAIQTPTSTSNISPHSLAMMLVGNMRHIPDPWTAYEDIHRLQAGHAMLVKDGVIKKIWRHWTPHKDTKTPTSEDLYETLSATISEQMEADVAVGALLSGGIDSTAIVGLMKKHTQSPIHTYALGMNPQDEDLSRARHAAKYHSTIHKEFYFDPDEQWEIYKKMIKIYGEPIALLPLTHSYVLSRSIRDDGIKVVLSGNGADELFYGYVGHIHTSRLSKIIDLTSPISKTLRPFIPEACQWIFAPPGERKARLYQTRAYKTLRSLLNQNHLEEINNRLFSIMSDWGRLYPSEHYIDESNFVGLMVENTHSITTIGDLAPMMASVEMRSPFLSQNIVSLALSIPHYQKVSLFAKDNDLKKILRQAVTPLIPPELLYAPKRGFGYGIQEATLLKERWLPHLETLFNNDSLNGIFRPEKIKELLELFKNGDTTNTALISKLLSIKIWMSQN